MKKSLMENFILCAVSPIFLVWKFQGNPQFPNSFGQFTQNFHIRKLDEVSVFYTVPTLNYVLNCDAVTFKI